MTINNQKVRHADITIYEQHQYPGIALQAYPKVDSQNLPKVDLKIYNKIDGILKRLTVLADEEYVCILNF